MVDISTPASVIDTISHAMRAHMETNASEYKSGSETVSFSSNGDPLKVQLVAAFTLSHNGKSASTNHTLTAKFLCAAGINTS